MKKVWGASILMKQKKLSVRCVRIFLQTLPASWRYNIYFISTVIKVTAQLLPTCSARHTLYLHISILHFSLLLSYASLNFMQGIFPNPSHYSSFTFLQSWWQEYPLLHCNRKVWVTTSVQFLCSVSLIGRALNKSNIKLIRKKTLLH